TVALLAAAQDDRIAGVAVSSAFTPLRSASEHVEGLQSYSHLHGLIPRLGFFKDHPQRLPVDFPEIIASLAPKPVFILAAELDRHAQLEQLKAAMIPVQQFYEKKASNKITVRYPAEINRFIPEHQQEMVDWMIKQVKQ